MSQTCEATTRRGDACRAAAVAGSKFCALHGDPSRAARIGRLGGQKNRHYFEPEIPTVAPPKTAEEVARLLAESLADLRMKKIEPRLATAFASVCTTLLKAIEITDHESRIKRLEDERAATGRSESPHELRQ